MTLSLTRKFGLAIWLLVAAGCASLPSVVLPDVEPETRELTGVPFFPQEDYQCGPAALATALGASGVATQPDALVGEIYVPGRKGSLQVEIVASVRRHARIAYQVEPTVDAIVKEVNAGNPVLVLVNFGPSWYPVWHYAVVIGYSTPDATLTLRSGRNARSIVPAARFLARWERSRRWGLVVLEPTRLPAVLDEQRYVTAVIDLERTGGVAAARDAYRALLARQPDNETALFGLGSTSLQLGDAEAAERTYRRLLSLRPNDALVENNLALALAARGCIADARDVITRALDATRDDPSRRAAIEDSAAEIERRSHDATPGTCAPGVR